MVCLRSMQHQVHRPAAAELPLSTSSLLRWRAADVSQARPLSTTSCSWTAQLDSQLDSPADLLVIFRPLIAHCIQVTVQQTAATRQCQDGGGQNCILQHTVDLILVAPPPGWAQLGLLASSQLAAVVVDFCLYIYP
jgi:hypothetical protein